MTSYFISNDKKDCFNCGLCSSICPVKAIKNEKDSAGYFFPIINKEKCINCRKCETNCINVIRDELVNKTIKSYVLKNNNLELRKKSASGGISSILMQYVLNKNGVVYGVTYTDDLKVVHKRATTLEECEAFKTSKYVKSYMLDCFPSILSDVKNNKLVLVTGTPCQIASIKTFIPKKFHENLLLCEIMCDAVASPVLFEKFKEHLRLKYNKEIKNINFRSKDNGAHNMSMKILFSDMTELVMPIKEKNDFSDYMQIYGCGLSAPYSCLNCEFENMDERVSDFTIGDYWGRKEIIDDDNFGISMLLLNSNKACEIFDNYIKNQVSYKEVSVQQALDNNHIYHKDIVLNKNEFMFDLTRYDFKMLVKKYVNKYSWRTKIGKYVPKGFKNKIKKVMNYKKRGY